MDETSTPKDLEQILTFANPEQSRYEEMLARSERERLKDPKRVGISPHELKDEAFFGGYFGIPKDAVSQLKEYLRKKLEGMVLVDIEPHSWYEKARIAHMLGVQTYVALRMQDEQFYGAGPRYEFLCRLSLPETQQALAPMKVHVIKQDPLAFISRIKKGAVCFSLDRTGIQGSDWYYDKMPGDLQYSRYGGALAKEITRVLSSGGIIFSDGEVTGYDHLSQKIWDKLYEDKGSFSFMTELPGRIMDAGPYRPPYKHYFCRVLERKNR